MAESLIYLLSAALGTGKEAPNRIDYPRSLFLARSHGLTGMLYHALPNVPTICQPEPAVRDQLKKLAYTSAIRDALQDRELAELNQMFGERAIPFLLLKGFEVKKLYPKPEMRHMSDTDILINPEQAEAVRKCVESLGYCTERFDNGDTDVYRSPSGLCYEVHRSLAQEGFNPVSYRFLGELYSLAERISETNPMLRLSYEAHYAYILCHFVKHFLNGGIGVRQVMDIHLCRTKWQMDEKKLMQLLRELELAEFAASVEALGAYWFGNGATTEVTAELGEYILASGAFGSEEHKVANRMLKEEKKQSKMMYFFSRVFPPYNTMCFYYPVLKKGRILLPAFWLWRIIYALIFRRGKMKRELSTFSEIDKDALHQRAAFYRRCGLKVYDQI